MTDWPCKDKIYYEAPEGVIYCADCRDILPHLPKVDLMLTDPPYGIGENAYRVAQRGKAANSRDYGSFDWDKKIDHQSLDLIVAAGVNQIIWGGNYYADWLPASSCWLVWDKDNSGDFADCELAWTSFDLAVRKFKWRWNGMIQENMKCKEYRFHPTQKPVALMKWVLSKYLKEGEIVIDMMFGSGTVLLAAKELNRRFIGIEISEKYCQIAVERLRQSVMRLE
jgi:DNA modification methylase